MSEAGHQHSPHPATADKTLLLLGAGQLMLWVAFSILSWRFHPDDAVLQRPILSVLGLLALIFTLYLASARHLWSLDNAISTHAPRLHHMWMIAILIRVVALFSLPVQEIDYYRYLWDGRQMLAGVSPYSYSPENVDHALHDPSQPRSESMSRLIEQLEASSTTRDIFDHIDHRQVASIYPPSAQAVFGVVAIVTPISSPVFVHLLILKAVLIGFDLLVIGLLVSVLTVVGMNPALALLYAWCPLVIKEFANSAHMDVIAIALLMGGIRLATSISGSSFRVTRAGSSILWGAAILAKFYPLVLAPLWWSWWSRSLSLKARLTQVFFVIVVIVAGYSSMPANDKSPDAATSQGTFSGLGAFVSRWEMNDLLFAIIHENLRPAEATAFTSRPWFAFVPESWRSSAMEVAHQAATAGGIPMKREQTAFLLAQIIATSLVACIALWIAFRPWPQDSALSLRELPRRAFATLAVMWYLSATQNPWYWTWALPFLAFTTNRVWTWTGGLALIYYLRFWHRYHEPVSWLPPGYGGMRLFDEILVWVEHLPVLLIALLPARHKADEFPNPCKNISP